MSDPLSQEAKERIWEIVCEDHPNLTEDERMDIAREIYESEVYWSHDGHPSLSDAQRNPSL